jgi:hypothetical protein
MNIVGLGQAGCAVARKFANYPQYNVYQIDAGIKGAKKDGIFNVPKLDGAEAYEESFPSTKTFFKNVSGDVLFILAGSGHISGASLRVLEHLRKHNVSILYIRPDTTLLRGERKLIERITFNVLQQYTRSGVFNKMYIINNVDLEKIIGDVPLTEHHDRINELITSTVHMVNVYSHVEPVYDYPVEDDTKARIATIGLLDVNTGEEKLFFPLDSVTEKCYYYAISDESLNTDATLHRKITEQIKEKTTEELNIGYSIYSTEYDQNYGYLVANSSEIQLE